MWSIARWHQMIRCTIMMCPVRSSYVWLCHHMFNAILDVENIACARCGNRMFWCVGEWVCNMDIAHRRVSLVQTLQALAVHGRRHLSRSTIMYSSNACPDEHCSHHNYINAPKTSTSCAGITFDVGKWLVWHCVLRGGCSCCGSHFFK